jgi:hypothetical protein
MLKKPRPSPPQLIPRAATRAPRPASVWPAVSDVLRTTAAVPASASTTSRRKMARGELPQQHTGVAEHPIGGAQVVSVTQPVDAARLPRQQPRQRRPWRQSAPCTLRKRPAQPRVQCLRRRQPGRRPGCGAVALLARDHFAVLVVVSLDLPYAPAGLPWNDGVDASLVNHTPFAIVLPLIFGVWSWSTRRMPDFTTTTVAARWECQWRSP